MTLNVYLDKGAKIPTKAHEEDAGFDIYTPVDIKVKSKSSAFVDTGVHIDIPNGYVGMLKSKSGLNCKAGIVSEGVIDAGYSGSIGVKLYNHAYDDYTFAGGEKITQLVIMPVPCIALNKVDSIGEFHVSERCNNGFGSTGK